jgi:hypothetical protein
METTKYPFSALPKPRFIASQKVLLNTSYDPFQLFFFNGLISIFTSKASLIHQLLWTARLLY